MCGIIGYIGKENSVAHLMKGLEALEYRGYDSAGIAFFDRDGGLHCVKAAGRLRNVEEKLASVRKRTARTAASDIRDGRRTALRPISTRIRTAPRL